MTLELRSIPFADDEPPEAVPTTVLSGAAGVRSRRTFLKAVVYAALSFGVAALTVPFLGRTRRAEAEVSPRGGLQGWDRNDCKDAYPGGYNEQSDTHGIYRAETAACFGGTYMGWNWCNSDGWHRSDKNIPSAPPGWTWECWPVSGLCGPRAAGKNAWRWTTQPGGKVWRCSDGNSKVRQNAFLARWRGPYLSICRARVG